MSFRSCGRYCNVQSHISKRIVSTLTRLSLPFCRSDKLADAHVLPLEPINVLLAALVSSVAPPKANSNEEVQDIIQTVIEARPAVVKRLQERYVKAKFLDFNLGNNHMAYYNFYQ